MSRIGFDLDGVVYDFRAAHADFEVSRGNAHCAVELAADGWDYYLGWGLTLDQWLESYREGVDAGHILWVGEPMPGAVDVSRRLRADGHTVHIVTDRSIGQQPQEATKAWLADVGFEYDTIDFSRDKTVVPTDVFIEDRLVNADAVNAAGSLCYLINRPWNLPLDDRPRVDTLEEFYGRVCDLTQSEEPIGFDGQGAPLYAHQVES